MFCFIFINRVPVPYCIEGSWYYGTYIYNKRISIKTLEVHVGVGTLVINTKSQHTHYTDILQDRQYSSKKHYGAKQQHWNRIKIPSY